MNYPSWRLTQISSIEGKERGGQEGEESMEMDGKAVGVFY
jgi:hypothetical protein